MHVLVSSQTLEQHVCCRALPWADKVVGHLSRFLATLEDEVDGRDSRNGSGEVADLPATVAASGHTGWGVPMLQPGNWDEEPGRLGKED